MTSQIVKDTKTTVALQGVVESLQSFEKSKRENDFSLFKLKVQHGSATTTKLWLYFVLPKDLFESSAFDTFCFFIYVSLCLALQVHQPRHCHVDSHHHQRHLSGKLVTNLKGLMNRFAFFQIVINGTVSLLLGEELKVRNVSEDTNVKMICSRLGFASIIGGMRLS